MFETTSIPRLVIAGIHSGTGKTTVTLGLATALRRRGHNVQTFKVGLDVHDGAYLAHATGRPTRNLDSWILGAGGVARALARGSVDADVALIEGGMGLLDGHGPAGDDPAQGVPAGSTADVALRCDAPILLVLDVSSMGETAAALALGVRSMAPSLPIVGALLNGVRSDHDLRRVEDAIWHHAKLPVLGTLPRMPEVAISEWRHGLAPLSTNPQIDDAVARLADAVERHCNLDLLLRLMRGSPALPIPAAANGQAHAITDAVPLRIAVGFDEAFCTYYPENLELLAEAGAEIVTFSPLEEAGLPDGVDAVYLGGGCTEVHAERLAENRPLKDALRRAHAAGVPVYCEGGGTLFAVRRLRLPDGSDHEMTGLLPLDLEVRPHRSGDAYRDLRVAEDCPLGPEGTQLRGHEYPAVPIGPDCGRLRPAYSMRDPSGHPVGCEGWLAPGLVASLVHLHFGQEPDLAYRLVAGLRAARRGAGAAIAAV